MNVLFVSAEADPFAKVGGMADVVGSLPPALRARGVDARVLIPFYGFINPERYSIRYQFSFPFSRRTGTTDVQVFQTNHNGVPVYLVRGWPYFGPDQTIYTEWNWDAPRFIFFSQVAMAVAWEIRGRQDWFPDVFHVNDWHTGLIPFLLAESRQDPNWREMGSVLSIHNMAYQGESVGGWLWQLGIPGRTHPELLHQGKTDNLLGIAVAYSDIVSTVSPRYALEIQYPYMGYGLEGLIRARRGDLIGILNGLDVDQWNPDTDPQLVSNYSASTFMDNRPPNKRHLQAEAGLETGADVPLIGIVSRLVQQKGFDLALPALRRLLTESQIQLVVLGSGEPELDYQFQRLGQDLPRMARVYSGYNAALAPRIYAGCDIFLMPSHFEPCGIGQMIAMRYGALPLVRETGGLADTVENYDNGSADYGTGFVFNWEQTDAVLNTIRWATDTFHHRKDAWSRMQERALLRDFGWDRSAQSYMEIYESAVDKHRR